MLSGDLSGEVDNRESPLFPNELTLTGASLVWFNGSLLTDTSSDGLSNDTRIGAFDVFSGRLILRGCSGCCRSNGTCSGAGL